jgi:hypothetical protein
MTSPYFFDTDFRVVTVRADDLRLSLVYEVECFEFYGPAVRCWREVHQRLIEGRDPRGLVDVLLIDPDGYEVMNKRSAEWLSRSGEGLRDAEPGRYSWNESTDRYESLSAEGQL